MEHRRILLPRKNRDRVLWNLVNFGERGAVRLFIELRDF
jgi:hypothetical protein